MKIANTKKQSLINHSICVAMLSKKIFEQTISKENYDDFLEKIEFGNKKRFSYEKIKNSLFYAGLFHDLGKLDDNFQNYLNEKLELKQEDQEYDVQIEKLKKTKIDIYKYPTHNEISFAILSSLFSNSIFNIISDVSDQKIIENIAYFHHAKIMRDKEIDFDSSQKIFNSDQFDKTSFIKNMKEFLNELFDKTNKYCEINIDIKDKLDEFEIEDIIEKDIKIPVFQSSQIKTSTDLFKNAMTHFARSIVVSADRQISALSANELEEIIQDDCFDFFSFNEDVNLNQEIDDMLDKFESLYPNSSRSKEQSKVAKELSETNDIAVLKGPAGVGKTKIMLEYIKNINNNKRTFIIVPKTSIAISLYKEITKEYLPKSKIEINIGELKETSKNNDCFKTEEKDLFNGDVVITTIDQVLNMMLGHLKIDVFLEILNSNLIFDEFHEFLYIPAISVLFIEIIYLKHVLFNKNCLLVSATPNYFLLEKLYLDKNKNIKRIRSFNDTRYQINLHKFSDEKNKEHVNEMYDSRQIGEICIFNAATKAQLSAMKAIDNGEANTLVYHSKFSHGDKIDLFRKILKEFGKEKQTKNNVLRVGPILQASVDISTKHMLTEISNIDNIYQRLGRVARWGETKDGTGKYSIFIPDNFSVTGTIASGLKNVNCFNATTEFAKFFETKIEKDKLYSLNELYEFYDEFFSNNKREIFNLYQLDFDENLKKSSRIFEQNFQPMKIIKKTKKDDVKKMPKKSLRGNSLFCFVLNYIVDKKGSHNVVEPESFKNNIISFNRDDFYGDENLNKYLEESRDMIAGNKGKSKNLEEIYSNIKNNLNYSNKKVANIPPHWFVNLARNENTPLVLSFKDKTKKINYEDQYFNLIYKDVKIGVMSKNKF